MTLWECLLAKKGRGYYLFSASKGQVHELNQPKPSVPKLHGDDGKSLVPRLPGVESDIREAQALYEKRNISVAEKAAPQLLTRPVCSLAARWRSKADDLQSLLLGIGVPAWPLLNRVH
jgi:hypothetical protein